MQSEWFWCFAESGPVACTTAEALLKSEMLSYFYHWPLAGFSAARLMLLDWAASFRPPPLFFLKLCTSNPHGGIAGVNQTICYWEDICNVCLNLFPNESCLLKFCKLKVVSNESRLISCFLWIGVGYKQYCCNFIFYFKTLFTAVCNKFKEGITCL